MIAENQSTQNTASDSQGLSAEFRAKLITDERAIAAAQLAYHKAVITPAIAHGEQPPVELASPRTRESEPLLTALSARADCGTHAEVPRFCPKGGALSRS